MTRVLLQFTDIGGLVKILSGVYLSVNRVEMRVRHFNKLSYLGPGAFRTVSVAHGHQMGSHVVRPPAA